MTFSPVFWTDVLMMHEMCRLAVLVLFQCAVPASKLAIGASMSYLWDSSCLFKERGPFILFTWEQVSKCQFQWFIFHVRIEMSHPSIITALEEIYFKYSFRKNIEIWWYHFKMSTYFMWHQLSKEISVSTPDFLGVGTHVKIIFPHLRKLEIQQRKAPSGNTNN